MEDDPYVQCIDCDEPDSPGSCPDGRCRDCDLAYVAARGACRECLKWIGREDMFGPRAAQHDAECSLASAKDYAARDADELAAMRFRLHGWTASKRDATRPPVEPRNVDSGGAMG